MESQKYIQMLFTVWGKAKEIVRQDGVPELLGRSCRKIKRLLWRSNCSIWYERNLIQPVVHFLPDNDIEIEFLTKDRKRLEKWLKLNHREYPWIYFEPEIESAVRNDHVFVILTQHERIIGYVKVGVNQVYINDFRGLITLPAEAAFIYDTFVLPECRGKKLAQHALNKTMQFLAGQGYEKLLCHIEKWNKPSIKTFKRAGFVSKGTIRYLYLAGFHCFLRNGYLPNFNLDSFFGNR